MTRTYLFIAAVLFFNIAKGQVKTDESFYLFQSDWSATQDSEKAAYFGRLTKNADTCWQWDIYKMYGPLVKSEYYMDKQLTKLHGRQHYFKPSGFMDSSGNMVNGFQHGDWNFLNDTGRTVLKKEYNMGTLERTIDMLKDTVEEEKVVKDVLEVESTFPGGPGGWRKYLTKNLRYPDRAYKASIKGEVVAQFIVDTTGNVTGVDIYRSVEYSLDEETMRLIKKSPKWTPATQNGQPVKSYKRQPLKYNFN